ncbi:PP2C family protein-serine/threonine phosphatase [Zooshikella harenae]|uniref:Serine/threonine-protein phosphatase n=1 Tax=Zooshikella harenae TaxID=2827238 RepID=A0ABS5ZH65_9GAMM|nr:protein phosphatase 2C domain-containing protein [Zooshikella harenae]MBU2713339.1 serine/threonine-protein phosphatase [Zooshikella harenae]
MSNQISHYLTAAQTHKGNVRRINEDAYLIGINSESGYENHIWAIADGMGGHFAGDLASRMIIDELARLPMSDAIDDAIETVQQTLLEVNRRLIEDVTIKPGSSVIGSTVVTAVLNGYECACIWAGDSRLYVFRDDALYQISHDHSVVQELVDQGVITAEEALVHPQANVITRAIGSDIELALDVRVFDVMPGDRLLLCSDGLYGEVPVDVIKSGLRQRNIEQCVQKLIESTLAGRAKDNVTVNVIDIQ